MNKLLILLNCLSIIGCGQRSSKVKITTTTSKSPQVTTTDNYELILPEKQDALLIVFPCFPCDAENTKTEFDIIDQAVENNIAVLLMNFNQHLWLSDEEKEMLTDLISDVVEYNKINTDNTVIGGFSSGGNVSLLLTNHLKSTNARIQPKGLFVVDSPIDLLGLYESAQKTIAKDYSKVAVEEANWIINTFDSEFGAGDSSIAKYKNKSPYVLKYHSLKNLSNLEDVNVRFYSEPDTTWWRRNRQTEYQDMNAFYIEQLVKDLYQLYGKDGIDYIQTENKGYRANGERHPHSWSIIDKAVWIDWILTL